MYFSLLFINSFKKDKDAHCYTSLAPCLGTKRGKDRLGRVYESGTHHHSAGVLCGIVRFAIGVIYKLFCQKRVFSTI